MQNVRTASPLFEVIFIGSLDTASLEDTLNWTQHCARCD